MKVKLISFHISFKMDTIETSEVVDILQGIVLPPRILLDRKNPVEFFNDHDFFEHFRMRKASFITLCDLIKADIETVQNNKSYSLQPIQTLALGVAYISSGSFFWLVADTIGVHKTTAMRAFHKVVISLCQRRSDFIKFPADDEIVSVKERFYRIARFPGVVSAIDCTHVRITRPCNTDFENYRNRKNYFSLNVQATCDASLRITNIVSRWCGSTHDSRIFDNSRLCSEFENGDHNGVLLGDSGYACRKYLLTPLRVANTVKERRYNMAHIKTRNVIERCFGVMKQRFQCLLNGMRLSPKKVGRTVVACAVLHNFLISQQDAFEIVRVDVDSSETAGILPSGHSTGMRFRTDFIQRHF